ncbi:hypothetical protein ElyMa_002515000 [Elysia marginata]|uniref:DUF3592 domain-containing protein n=1 Tax=Elysia marginata TaxID=1093978 RepID=A0AAV4GVF3_9GAST|nr:hypothetical protein ElyMa_002515000 [Elysia marginata]
MAVNVSSLRGGWGDKNTPASGGGCKDISASSSSSSLCAPAGVSSRLRKGVSVFGRIYSVVGAIIGAIIAIICILLGVSALRSPYTATAQATVTQVTSCVQANATNQAAYTCVVNVSYTAAGKQHIATDLIVTQNSPPRKGSTLTLHYNPSAPSKVVHAPLPQKQGWVLISIGILVGGFTTGVAVATFKSEAFAEGYGLLEIVLTIFRLF